MGVFPHKRTVIEGVATRDREVILSFCSRISVPFMMFTDVRAGGDSAPAEDVFQEALTRLVLSRKAVLRLADNEPFEVSPREPLNGGADPAGKGIIE